MSLSGPNPLRCPDGCEDQRVLQTGSYFINACAASIIFAEVRPWC